jgi:hypothetical protein
MPILCYNGSLVTWTVISLTTAKFKPLIFYMSGFALSYTANMFGLIIVYDFCLSSAQPKKSKLKLSYDQQSVNQSVLVSSTMSGPHDQIFTTVRQLSVRWCGAPSLTREGVYRLKLLLALTSAFWGPKPIGLMTIFYCFSFGTPSTWRARYPCLCPPGTW